MPCNPESSVTLAHKTLRIVVAMLNNHMPYQDQAVHYEALVVQRNAPHPARRKSLLKHGCIIPPGA